MAAQTLGGDDRQDVTFEARRLSVGGGGNTTHYDDEFSELSHERDLRRLLPPASCKPGCRSSRARLRHRSPLRRSAFARGLREGMSISCDQCPTDERSSLAGSDAHPNGCRLVAEFIGLPVGESFLNPPPASHKLNACRLWSRPSRVLRRRRRPNSPAHMMIVLVEQSAGLEILEQSDGGFVGSRADLRQSSSQFTVVVPNLSLAPGRSARTERRPRPVCGPSTAGS